VSQACRATQLSKLGTESHNRSAIVLAGGEGKRLRGLTRQLGYDVPKQFCPLLEQETLLELTLGRVALAIDPAQTLTVVTRSHERFFAPLMAELARHDPHRNPGRNLIIQPDNRGTATAIAYGAFRLAEMDPAASVAVFPSDHWFSDDAELMRSVERAFALVSEFQELTVALGVAAERPEAGYGWFELGAPILNEADRLFEVRRFWEKPPAETTRAIWSAGACRNSFILVAKVSALLSLILRTLPRLHRAFHSVRPVLGTMFEGQTIESLYRDLPQMEFSQRVMARALQALAVLAVGNLEWSDLGDPQRVLNLLKRIAQTGQREQLASTIRNLRRRPRRAA
jgi:mannose-1-phosphate guanylyltransferase